MWSVDRSRYGHFLTSAHPALGETGKHRRLKGGQGGSSLPSRALSAEVPPAGAEGLAAEEGRLSLPRCGGPSEHRALCAAGRAGALVPAKKTNAFPLSPGNASTAPAERVHFKAR